MFSKFWLYSLVLISQFFWGFASFAQSYRLIVGTVVDATDGRALEGATIAVSELGIGTVSGSGGHFSISLPSNGDHQIRVSFVGYETQSMPLSVVLATKNAWVIRLKASNDRLQELVVIDKSEVRKIRAQAMPVSVMSAHEITGRASSVEGILMKTVGVSVRSQGGVGGATRVSVRGLEGKRVGIFVDGTPMNSHSDFLSINDIPTHMIERVEVYKGIVPAKLGGSGMGGAVNIVLKEYPAKYLDVAYGIESFNTHKVTLVAKHHNSEKQYEVGGGGYYTHSDNNYVMEPPMHKGLLVERDHDRFDTYCASAGFKLLDRYLDEVGLEAQLVRSRKEIQGILYNIRDAHSKSLAAIGSVVAKKKDFLTPGLDLDYSGACVWTQYNFVDTASMRYTWDLKPYPTLSPMGGETGHFPSNSTIRTLHATSKLDLEYLINANHALNIHLNHMYTHADPKDELRKKANGHETLFKSNTHTLTLGTTYTFTSSDTRWVNAFTAKYYHYSMQTQQSSIFGPLEVKPISIAKHFVGVSDALRYRITPFLMGKGSLAYEVRTPTETELIGDGFLIAPSKELLPERGLNGNLSLLWDSPLPAGQLQVEATFFCHLPKGYDTADPKLCTDLL